MGGGLRSAWRAWLSLANAGSWNEGSLDPKFSPDPKVSRKHAQHGHIYQDASFTVI